VRSTLRSRAQRAWGWKPEPNPEPTGPRELLVKAREDALDPLTPHEARHTCASYLAAAGLTPKEAQTAMGHADIRTTLNICAKAVPAGRGRRRQARRLP
jgi:integrase